MPIMPAASSLQGVAGLATYVLAQCHAIQMGGLLLATLRRNMESLLYGTRCLTPPAPAPEMVSHGKSDSCLSVAAPSPISLPRYHPQLLTSRGGAHILVMSHHPEGMHATSLILHLRIQHLAILGAVAPFRLY